METNTTSGGAREPSCAPVGEVPFSRHDPEMVPASPLLEPAAPSPATTIPAPAAPECPPRPLECPRTRPNEIPCCSPGPAASDAPPTKQPRQSRLRQDGTYDPYFIRGIARPRSPWQWFLRRLYLEDKLGLFGEFCRAADPDGKLDYQKVGWKIARKHFKFKSQASERERCEALEESRDEEVRRRASIIWDEEAERNGGSPPVFGGGRESSYVDDVRWCWEHWPTYVRRRGKGEWALAREKELMEQAPSQGAYGLILFAQEDLKQFQSLCRSVLTKVEATQEAITEEQKIDRSLEKLRAVVEGFLK